MCREVIRRHDLVSLTLSCEYKSCRVNTAITPYYRVMHDSKSQDDKSWGIGNVLFSITKSCRISQSTYRSLRLMAFQLKQWQSKIDSPKHNSILS